eukprot:TRINITY_DN72631_c0_g1_i1.p1 TRINITY_DN72631_c0_g1~~TRINITY_DN72631_c0_g1_i1.p1  ORF type:complete len:392 (+),score=71.67 TRINITY_DN72631_c0_g1_i1:55-1176(+)
MDCFADVERQLSERVNVKDSELQGHFISSILEPCMAPTSITETSGKERVHVDFDNMYALGGEAASKWMNLGLKRPDHEDGSEADKSEFAEIVKLGVLGGNYLGDDGVTKQHAAYVEACERLAARMYNTLGSYATDTAAEILDVGCGFGDQAHVFRQLFPSGPKYTGINIAADQVRVAAQRTSELRDVTFLQASATDLSQFAASRFAHCFSLECAFHFNTRATFFQEALRVLQPGGSVTIMDIVWPDRDEIERKEVLSMSIYDKLVHLGMKMRGTDDLSMQLPRHAELDLASYKASMQSMGFEDVHIEDLSQQILMWGHPLFDAVREVHPHFTRDGMNLRTGVPCVLNLWWIGKCTPNAKYVCVRARKPSNAVQ